MTPQIEEQKKASEEELKLKIDAHVVRQLGEELITDPEQAILELVKNSYDADADWCDLEIDTKFTEAIVDYSLDDTADEEERKKNTKTHVGKIIIKDNGDGMTRDQINSGWLTISHSEKREKKRNKEKTKKGRSLTGDKGLGRLGSMKLAKVIRISTFSKETNEDVCVEFNWDDFLEGTTLDQVSVLEKNKTKLSKPGTKIELIGLIDPEFWVGEDRRTHLTARLSTLLSPFGHISGFQLLAKIDKISLSFSDFSDQLKEAAQVKFSFVLNNRNLICEGAMKLNYLMGKKETDRERYKKFIAADKGHAFIEKLKQHKKLGGYDIKTDNDSAFYLTFSQCIDWEDLPSEKHIQEYPGDLKSEIYYYNLERKENFNIDGTDTFAESKKLFNQLKGVSIYRDGFKVGTGRITDWLGMSEEKTSGDSFYSIRYNNTIGFFGLTNDHNSGLIETSDRQGFVENEFFEGFWTTTRAMLDFINIFLEASRRSASSFLTEMDSAENGHPKELTAEQAIEAIEDVTTKSVEEKVKYAKQSQKTEKTIISAQKNIENALNDLMLDPKARIEIESLQGQVSEVARVFTEYSKNYNHFISELSRYNAVAEKVTQRLDDFNSQISEYNDHVAIGLSAQQVAHDINPQLDNISLHNNALKDRLIALNQKDRTLFSHLKEIGVDVSLISKNLSLLNPMLRNRRLLLDDISILDVVSSYIELRSEFFEREKINIVLTGDKKPIIHFNRGRLTQIIDNLVRNSSYWLKHYSTHSEFKKEIFIEITDVGFLFWDSGRGIRKGIEDSIFEMFITDKPDGQGQGLGLFIIRSLLAQADCTIDLLPIRNDFGRRFKFEIEFERKIVDAK